MKYIVLKLTAVCWLLVSASDGVVAQRGAGRMRGGQGGSMMGGGSGMGRGGMGGGGCGWMNDMSSGSGGSQFMSDAMGFNSNSDNTALANQVMANQGQALGGCRNSSGKTNSTANAAQARATAAQFAQKAILFDADGDGELDQKELTQVATAVIDELQLRQQCSGRLVSKSFFRIKRDTAADAMGAASTTTQMTAAFVAKSLTYDKDHNGTLDTTETRALANALIRTLG